MKILIADDNAFELKVLTAKLRSHEVHWCLSAASAELIVKNRPNYFDLVLVDIVGTVHTSPEEFLKDIESIDSSSEIAFMSNAVSPTSYEVPFIDKKIIVQYVERKEKENA